MNYQCPECDRVFYYSENYKEHYMVRHGLRVPPALELLTEELYQAFIFERPDQIHGPVVR